MENNEDININEQLTILEETKSQIKQAIIDKGQSISSEDSFRSYVDKIEDIEVLNAQTKEVTPTTNQQVIVPDQQYNAISQLTVNSVTSDIDNNIISDNIKKDIEILGIRGNYEGNVTQQEYTEAINDLNDILGEENS